MQKDGILKTRFLKLVDFFSMNSFSSPIMIRIHFDLLYTVIADTIYQLFASDLKRFERCRAKTIFKSFINTPGQIEYDGSKFIVKIKKRATTPLLLGVEKLNKEIVVPWLKNKLLRIIWTA